ncbi:hypothetical protein GALLR39Z86_10160 [Glycomyces algeriensis]|uniref:Uncharacterized protein n=1 Tax=Glycomyces algeriensis TaxID=256037 RepID=A0A9W6G617_9ACTN|nr:hypothetical protein GALLR39Z86_10160 [Glycomyces algeriensis]
MAGSPGGERGRLAAGADPFRFACATGDLRACRFNAPRPWETPAPFQGRRMRYETGGPSIAIRVR